MRCMKKIDEAFNEDDHPRGQPDNAGQFVASGTGSKTKSKTKRKTKRITKPKPKQYDTPFSWRDTSKPLSTKQKFNYRSRLHDIKTYRSRGKNYPQRINISDATNPELVKVFTGFWNTDPSVKAMIKHIDYLGLEYQKNPKWGGMWWGSDKKVVIYDYPSQTIPYFKSTVVHEIVGHTFWDLAREWFRNDLIEFNELANKMPPVNQYCKDNEEEWKTMNDETANQIRALDKKYGIKKDEYGYTDVGEQLWGDDLDKYYADKEKIEKGEFIGNPSNEFMNRDSSSMTRYANEQHSAITEMMYDTLKDNVEKGADQVLIGDEDFNRMKVLWIKLHPKFPQKAGESWNPFNEELTMRCMKKIGGNEAETLSVIKLISSEAFVEQEHPRDGDGKFAKKGSSKLPKETVDKVIDKIKNTWDDVSPKVHGSHFLTPNGEIIGNYNHNTMVTDLAPMIDGFELTGKTGGGSIKEKDGTWRKLPDTIYATWNDITNFLAHTGFVRATNEGIGERGFGHSVNLTVNGILTNSQIRAIQRMEQTSSAGTTLVFDIMGDETQSGHGTFRDFMKAYRKNYGTEAFQEQEHPRDSDGKFTSKGGGGISIKDHMDKVDKLKDDLYIKEILKSDGIPNEMELEKARLTKIVDDERKVDSDREFEYHSSDGNIYKMSGTQEFENSMKDLSEHNEKMKIQQKEYDKDYRESYGWNEGDPLRWTEYNDDDGDSVEYGYGANYTYKHLSRQDKDALMRNIWNNNTRDERENKYEYLNSNHIPYVTEDGKTPEDLRDDLGKDNSIPSDYFFFTDKETNEQFSGKGMTQEEIKERAKHGIGSATIQNADGSIENKVVYDRPLNYDKFNSETIPANNFGEKGEKTDKLWDDLSSDARSSIISEYTNYDGVLYNEWLDKERGDYYEWRKGQDGVLSEQEENHSKMYSEYDKPEETTITLNDEEKLEFAKTLWRQEYLDKHTDEELVDQIKGEYEQYGLEEKEQKLWQEKTPKTYFSMDSNERKEYTEKYFDNMPKHIQVDVVETMDSDYYNTDEYGEELPEKIKFNYFTEKDQDRLQEIMEAGEDDVNRSEENHAYRLENYVRDMNPQKAIGFDYDKGIPSATSLDDLDKWADRMEKQAYSNTYEMNSKKAVIPTYPKVESRTVEEHEKQVEKAISELKDNTLPTEEYQDWSLRILEKEHEEFDDYAKEQMKEGKININEQDLESYKNIQTELYKNDFSNNWMFKPKNNKTEDDWKSMYFDHSLNGSGAKSVSSKSRDLKLFKNLLDKNPQLEEKYSELIQKKTDELNHTNYDLFIKTPEFYRGTSTDELDHYMIKNNLGKLHDWGEKNYPFTSLTVDKKSAQSPSEQRTKWEVNGDEITGGKAVITYEGDSVRELGLPVQYNARGMVNDSFMDASEMNGTPYPIKLYSEREVRINEGERIPKIKEINFGINIDKYKGDKITKEQMINLRNKYKSLVDDDPSRVKFYGFKDNFDTGESYLGESYTVEAFVEDQHPRDGDGKFTDKDGDQTNSSQLSDSDLEKQREEHEKNMIEQDKKLEPQLAKQKKEREITHGKDWEEFDDIFRKYPDIFKEGDYPDISSFSDELVTNVIYENEEFWKDEEWNDIDSKLDKLKQRPKSFADLKYEQSDKLYDVKDDKDNDRKVDKIRDKLRNEKYDKIRNIDEWRYVNADKVLSDLEKEYEETGESYIKDRIDKQKKYLEYHKKDADVERRIYNFEKRRLEDMLELAKGVPNEGRIVGVSEITDELVMNYHNFMTDKHEKLEQVKHDNKIEKLNKKKWDKLDGETEEGFNPRMTNVAYTVEYGKIIDLHNDMKQDGEKDGGYTDDGILQEDIEALYNNIPKKIRDYMNAVKNTESDYERSINFDLKDIANDIRYNVVTPLINDGYGISAVPFENRTHYWQPTKGSIESAVEILTKRKDIDYWKGATARNFQTRLHAGKGPPFNVGDKKHTEGGHWSKTKNEIKIYNTEGLYKLDGILPHEFAHSQFSAIEESAERIWQGVTFEQIRDGKLNEEEKNAQVFYTFSDEVVKIKEGVKSTELQNSINKNSSILDNEKLESYEGGIPEKVFTSYFMDYVRARDGKDVKDRRKAESINTEMFACLSELKYSNSRIDRRKLFMVKLAYPKLFKAYESMEGGVKGLPKDKITDSMKVGSNKSSNIRDVMNAVESKGKSYKVTEYLNTDHEPVDQENADIIWVKEYDSNNKLIGMESFIAESEEGISDEAFNEDDHPRGQPNNAGQFVDKDGGGSVSEYKETTMKNVETKPEVKQIQKKLDINVTNKVEDAIKELGIEDKIYDVAMQGSYEKGTDLPASGSDMDLFVVFNTNVSEEEKNQYGLEIGRKVLNKDFAESQGWTDYYDEEVTATSKYVQAFFKDGEQEVEVQIVPTKHLTLEQIRDKKLDGKDIEIGMERTPHQTEYMKTALKGKEGEVRVLKKFMKDAGLYGSNLKEQGFSGYSAEVLIDKHGSFENVIDFFANLKEGEIVDKQGGGKRNEQNKFSIIDPIDPNRDLVSAFSTQKIGKTINVAKKFKETGNIPDPEYRKMDSTTITFDSDEMNEDTLIGQVRKMAKSYQANLKLMGFNVETNTEKVNGIDVELPDFSFDAEWDNDKKKNIVKLNLGTDNMTIPKEYKDKGMPINPPNPKMPKESWDKKIQDYRDEPKNKGLDFIEEDGKLKAVKVFPFTDMTDAIDYLNKNPEGKLVNTKQTDHIKSNGRVSTGKSEFQNI